MRLRTATLCLLFFVFALSGSATFAQVPFAAQPLAPAAAAPGGAAFTLTVNGAGFVSASVVHWNGSPRPTTFVSGTQLTAAIGASDIATAGTAIVTVFNAANTGTGNPGGTSNAVFFQVTKATSAVNYNSANVSAGPGVRPGKTVVGDFNGDGKQDVATLNNDSSVSILLGNGDGTFQPASVISPIFRGSVTRGIAVGDFNGDGKLDLAVAIQYFDDIQGPQLRVYVYFGQGNGNFTPVQGIAVGGSTSGSVFLVADFNGDGNLDLLMDSAGPSTYGLVMWLGNGNGAFTQSGVLNPGNASLGTSFNAAVADLNRDGRIDRVLTYQDQSANATLAVLLNGGIGCGLGCPPPPTLTTVDSVAPPAGGSAYFSGIAIADFDGNGIPDLATNLTTCNSTRQCTTSLRIYSGKGDGTFQPPVTSSTPPGDCCIVGDFNGDGILDVVVGNQILLGQGNGTFTANLVALPHGASATADFDGDGTLDFVTPGFFPDGSSGIFVMLQRGNHPDFEVTVSPSFQSVAPGGSTSYTVQVTPIQGWNTDVALSVSGLPGGATASFQPATITGGNGSSTLTISTTTAIQPGRYGVTVTGTAGSVTYNLLIPSFEVGTFSLFAQASIGIVPGGSTSVLVEEIPSFGWTGDVTLSVSGLPSGVTASFQPVTVTGGNGLSTLTISAPTNIAPGTYPITITGTAASGLSRSVSVNLVVPRPDFFLSGSPFFQTVIPVGGSASYTIQVNPTAGWNRDVTLSLSGLPSGATTSFQPATVAGGSGTSVLTVTTANVVIDPNAIYYVLLITGNSSIGVSHVTDVALTVADFSLSASPASQRVVAGASTSFTVQGTATSEWRLDVPLSISGLPNGATASFSPDRIFSGRSSSSLAISTTTATPAGTYPLKITGTGGGGSHSVTVSLMVTGFVVSVPKPSHQLAAGQTIDYRVQVTPLPGWTGDVALNVSGLPSGATVSFNPATIPGGSGNSDLAITTTTGVTPGTYSLTVSGSGGGSVRSVVIKLVVQPPN